MKILNLWIAPVAITIVALTCLNEKKSNTPFNNINYFLDNIHRAGLAVNKDTTEIYENNHYRRISIANAVYCVYGFPKWYNLTIQPEYDTTSMSVIKHRIKLPVFKDSNGIKLYKELIFEKQNDTMCKSWLGYFSKDSTVFELQFHGLVYGTLYWFAKKIHSALYASGKTEIDSIISQSKIEQKRFFFNYKMQAKLGNYKINAGETDSRSSRCYPGKIIQFPGDTLSPQDSAAFRDCVIRYRRDHGLEGAFIIDTNLLKSLEIPLDPIEEGLKRYREEFAKKGG